MSPKPPVLTATRPITILRRHDFSPVRQNGSHVIVEHPDGRVTVVPMPKGRDLPKGTLKKMLKVLEDTGLSVDDLVRR